jgi:hypothetical protein
MRAGVFFFFNIKMSLPRLIETVGGKPGAQTPHP